MVPTSAFTSAQRIGAHVFGFSRDLAREFMAKGCQKNAAALTYMTLFALVPMMTVMYSMFSVIPAFDGVADQLNAFVFDNFVPETGDQVQSYLTDFSSQARNLTGAGVLMLVITAYLMLTNIERTFNGIWGVRHARRGLSSFLIYWAVLSIGPLMLGAGLMMSTYVLSLEFNVSAYDQLGLAPKLLGFLPLILTTTAFTLLFAAVPNCRVPIRYALAGGFVTAIVFELLKFSFGKLVSNSSFKLIYGAFAVVPLFLLWVNVLWMTILAGAVLVRTLSEQGYGRSKTRFSNIRAVLHCLAMFRNKVQSGDSVSDRDCLKIGISLVHWQELRSLLVNNKWISVTDNGAYVLCRDLRAVTIWDVAQMVAMPINEPVPDIANIKFDKDTEKWLRDFLQRRQHIEDYAKNELAVSLDELFDFESVEGTSSDKKRPS